MKNDADTIDRAINHLWPYRIIHHAGDTLTIACLLRTTDWRPLQAPWWRGKEVCIIGADLTGNFFLRHCDGSVRYWNHSLQTDSIIANSIKDFVKKIRE